MFLNREVRFSSGLLFPLYKTLLGYHLTTAEIREIFFGFEKYILGEEFV